MEYWFRASLIRPPCCARGPALQAQPRTRAHSMPAIRCKRAHECGPIHLRSMAGHLWSIAAGPPGYVNRGAVGLDIPSLAVLPFPANHVRVRPERIRYWKRTVVPPAMVDMSRFDPPKADNALLCFLVGVLSLMSTFALFMYWLVQPTVVHSAGAGALEREASVAFVLVSRSPIVEIEQSEVAAALLENESQGLQSAAAAIYAPRTASTPKPQTVSTPKLAKKSPRTPKPTQVVRTQRPHIGPFPRDAWAFAPGNRSFSGWLR